LYKYSYWLYICVLFISCLELRFVNFLLNEYCIVLYCIVPETGTETVGLTYLVVTIEQKRTK